MNLLAGRRRRQFLLHRVSRAYLSLQIRHPQCSEVLFDRHFLESRMLAAWYEGGSEVDADLLVELWADQWAWSGQARAKFTAQIRPMADEFLRLLELETG